MGKKVISFSLWGDVELYNIGAVANAEIAMKVYPDWTCLFYVLPGTPAIASLKKYPNVVIKEMPDEPGYWKMFWRLAIAMDPTVDYVIFRDCDSRLGWREKGAVDQWISSGKLAHIMRDVETHAGLLMLGGMWGVKGGVFTDMEIMRAEWAKTHDTPSKEDDQLFLKDMIWPRIKDDVLCHGVACPQGGPTPLPFPPHKPWRGEYVGMVIQPDDHERSVYYKEWKERYQNIPGSWGENQREETWNSQKSSRSFFRRIFRLMTPWWKR